MGRKSKRLARYIKNFEQYCDTEEGKKLIASLNYKNKQQTKKILII
jgi:hypothetical protein